MISDKLREDMKTALKAGDKERLSVIRMLLSEIKTARTRIGTEGEWTERDEERVVSGYAKKRKESLEKATELGRQDLADKEKFEYDVTVSYLPEAMDDAELLALVQSKIKETGATSNKDFGRVMKAVMEVVGSRAEGAVVSAVIREKLSG